MYHESPAAQVAAGLFRQFTFSVWSAAPGHALYERHQVKLTMYAPRGSQNKPYYSELYNQNIGASRRAYKALAPVALVERVPRAR